MLKRADEPAVKEAVKETVKPEIEKSVVVEFGGRQVAAKDVLAQAEKAYAKTHPGNRNQVYGAVHITGTECSLLCGNGEGSDDFRIDL